MNPPPARTLGPQAALAYARYSARALLRFDLEGQGETIRQLQERMALCEAGGDHSMPDQLRGMLERERNRELELEAALGSWVLRGAKAD